MPRLNEFENDTPLFETLYNSDMRTLLRAREDREPTKQELINKVIKEIKEAEGEVLGVYESDYLHNGFVVFFNKQDKDRKNIKLHYADSRGNVSIDTGDWSFNDFFEEFLIQSGYGYCDNCKQECRNNTLENVGNELFCKLCSDMHTVECFCCGILHLKSETSDFLTVNDNLYCPLGIEARIRNCYGCRNYVDLRGNVYRSRGASYCRDCFEDYFIQCASCGGRRHEDEMEYDSQRDNHYCPSCIDEDGRYDEFDEFESKRISLLNNTFKNIKSKRCFGIELEVDDGNLPYDAIDEKTCFGSKSDGSLNRGAELYSPILQGDIGYNQIKTLCGLLKNKKVTNDAGYHMHVDGRDLSWKEIKKLWLTYRIIEPMIYYMLPENRSHNSYCKASRISISDILKIRSLKDLKRAWYLERYSKDEGYDESYDSRYRGFNLKAWFGLNTVELRYHTGTVCLKKIVNWININLAIFDFALNHTEDEIINILDFKNCKMNYTIIRRIFMSIVDSKPLWQYYRKRLKKFYGLTKFGKYFPEKENNTSAFEREEKQPNSNYKVDVNRLLNILREATREIEEDDMGYYLDGHTITSDVELIIE